MIHSVRRHAGRTEQRAGFKDRQPDDIRMAARQKAHETFGTALARLAAGLAHPLAARTIPVDLGLGEPFEGDDRNAAENAGAGGDTYTPNHAPPRLSPTPTKPKQRGRPG